MNRDILISVIIPVYNVEGYLKKCVQSILDQTYKNIELVLVDDGSTDSSGNICDEYSDYLQVKVVHKKNGGLSDARNAGLDVATGDFIGFIDSDDYVDVDMYESMVNCIEDDVDMVGCGYVYESNFEKKLYYSDYDTSIKMSSEQTLRSMLLRKYVGVSCCTKLFRRSLFSSFRFKKGVKSEDLELIYKLIDICNNVVCIPKAFYHYVSREGSITHSLSKGSCLDGVSHISEMKEFIKKKYPSIIDEMDFLYLDWYMQAYSDILTADNRSEFKAELLSIKNDIIKNMPFYMKNKYIDKTMKFQLVGVRMGCYLFFRKILSIWFSIKSGLGK